MTPDPAAGDEIDEHLGFPYGNFESNHSATQAHGPIDAVTDALAGLIGADVVERDAAGRRVPSHPVAYVLYSLPGLPWVGIVTERPEWDQTTEALELSRLLGSRVIAYGGSDTAMCYGFDLFDSGRLIERWYVGDEDGNDTYESAIGLGEPGGEWADVLDTLYRRQGAFEAGWDFGAFFDRRRTVLGEGTTRVDYVALSTVPPPLPPPPARSYTKDVLTAYPPPGGDGRVLHDVSTADAAALVRRGDAYWGPPEVAVLTLFWHADRRGGKKGERPAENKCRLRLRVVRHPWLGFALEQVAWDNRHGELWPMRTTVRESPLTGTVAVTVDGRLATIPESAFVPPEHAEALVRAFADSLTAMWGDAPVRWATAGERGGWGSPPLPPLVLE